MMYEIDIPNHCSIKIFFCVLKQLGIHFFGYLYHAFFVKVFTGDNLVVFACVSNLVE